MAGVVLALSAYTLALYVSHRAARRAAALSVRGAGLATAALGAPESAGTTVAGQVRALIAHSREAAAVVEESRRMAARGLQRDAVARLHRQVEVTPENALVLATLGELQLALGDGEGAVRHLARALSMQSQMPGLRLRLGQALLLRGDYEAALDAAAWTLEQDPNQVEAHRLAARAALKMDVPDMALRHLRRILDLQGDDTEAWQTMPVVYLRQGEYGRAIRTLNEIIRRDHARPADYFNLAVAFAQQGQVEDTVGTLSGAALRFETGIVHPWMSEQDFDPVRADPRFMSLEQELSRNLSAAPTALRPGTPRTDQALGLLPEPEFLDRPIELRTR